MSNVTRVILLLIFTTLINKSKAADSSCADWEPYKDEKCFKILDDTLRTFDDAEKSCAKLEDSPTLSIIRSKEEQDFLLNYVFKTQMKVDNVWIGAKFTTNSFHWFDSSELSFTNWDSTRTLKNKTNYCVQMQSDEAVAGKWVDEPCERKNLVVCQKLQSWTIGRLQKIVLELRDSLDEANKRIATQNLVPIGFTYAQLPNEKSPTEIWPTLNWTDVSTTYAGVFFRVNGGDAATFGQVQQDNSPRLEEIISGTADSIVTKYNNAGRNVTIPRSGWSEAFYTGGNQGTNIYINFKQSTGEIRPRNMAIRVWKRTS